MSMASLVRCNAASIKSICKKQFPSSGTGVNTILTSIQRNMSSVGFIGLGLMGSRMVKNIITKGQAVSVFDINPTAIANMEKLGAKPCKTPADLVKQSDIVITMLPNNAIVLEAYQGKGGILENAKPGSLLIDSSTVDPSVPIAVQKLAVKAGATFIDAPVSGGVMGAEAGTLTFMVGGQAKELEMAREVLMLMGKSLFHCGNTGMGQAAKITNNMLLGITMLGTAEAMNLGMRLGLDKKLIMDVINVSTGRSWSSQVCNPVPGTMENVPSADNYKGGFGSRLICKDLGLAQDAATRTASPILLGSLTHQVYRLMTNQGYGDKDFSSVYQFLQDQEKKK